MSARPVLITGLWDEMELRGDKRLLDSGPSVASLFVSNAAILAKNKIKYARCSVYSVRYRWHAIMTGLNIGTRCRAPDFVKCLYSDLL